MCFWNLDWLWECWRSNPHATNYIFCLHISHFIHQTVEHFIPLWWYNAQVEVVYELFFSPFFGGCDVQQIPRMRFLNGKYVVIFGSKWFQSTLAISHPLIRAFTQKQKTHWVKYNKFPVSRGIKNRFFFGNRKIGWNDEFKRLEIFSFLHCRDWMFHLVTA